MTRAPTESPYALLGDATARTLAGRFYDHMDASEPALAALHPLDAEGKVHPRVRAAFTAFLVEWLGGPAEYSPVHGHPRLRMRHGHVDVDAAMRDAWLRCMQRAMNDAGVEGEVRTFLDARFADVADFLRNRPG